jgi:hypothetical protein
VGQTTALRGGAGSTVIAMAGRLDLATGRALAEAVRALPADLRQVEIRLPDARELPAPVVGACVLLARRLHRNGGGLRIVAGREVAERVCRLGLYWLLPVSLPARSSGSRAGDIAVEGKG